MAVESHAYKLGSHWLVLGWTTACSTTGGADVKGRANATRRNTLANAGMLMGHVLALPLNWQHNRCTTAHQTLQPNTLQRIQH